MNNARHAVADEPRQFSQKDFEALIASQYKSWLDVFGLDGLKPLSHAGEDPWCLCALDPKF